MLEMEINETAPEVVDAIQEQSEQEVSPDEVSPEDELPAGWRKETLRCRYCGELRDCTISQESIEKLGYIEAADLAIHRACWCDGSKKELKQRANRHFRGFVSTELINFMEQFQLEELSIKAGTGNKAKIKRNKDGDLNVETTVKEVM